MRNRERYNETKKRNNIILILAILLVLLLIGLGTFWLLKNYKTEETPTTTESLIGEEDTESSTKVAASTEKGTTEVKGTNKGKVTTEKGTTKGKTTGATTEENIASESRNTTETPTTEGTSPTERPTTTEAPTTERPTTERPTTTEEPTTERTTTEKPTTENPTTQEPTTECKHDWVAQYETKTEKVEVESAWDEEITEKRLFCSYCGKCVSGDTDHIFNCGEYYYDEWLGDWVYEGSSSVSRSVVVDVIHHPARYETKKTKVLIGHKCSKCGATK